MVMVMMMMMMMMMMNNESLLIPHTATDTRFTNSGTERRCQDVLKIKPLSTRPRGDSFRAVRQSKNGAHHRLWQD